MLTFVRKLKGRLRHGLATQELLDRLGRAGVVFYPYIVFRECDAGLEPARHTGFEIRRLGQHDTEQLVTVAARTLSRQKVEERFRNGHLAVGAFDGGSLVAYTWCNRTHFGGVGQKTPRRLLEGHEAYLYDAFTAPDYRGHGLVPQLRSELYRQLAADGRDELYSVSLYFNRSARRFKQKLGARPVELRLSVNLFDRFKRDLRLRRYAPADGDR